MLSGIAAQPIDDFHKSLIHPTGCKFGRLACEVVEKIEIPIGYLFRGSVVTGTVAQLIEGRGGRASSCSTTLPRRLWSIGRRGLLVPSPTSLSVCNAAQIEASDAKILKRFPNRCRGKHGGRYENSTRI